MCNDFAILQKANKYLAKNKLWRIITCVITCAVFVFLLYLTGAQNNIVLSLAAIAVIMLVAYTLSTVITRRCIFTVLLDQTDPHTFLAMIRQGNFDSPHAFWQLAGEYYCGNYQHVAWICKTLLEDPKAGKSSIARYTYLIYLARVYFDTEDDKQLRLVCEQLRDALKSGKGKGRKLVKRIKSTLLLYDAYLNQDTAAFRAHLAAPRNELERRHHAYLLARVALLEEHKAEAQQQYELLASAVPLLNYGKLAAHGLKKLNGATPTGNEPHELPAPCDTASTCDVTLYTCKSYRKRRVVLTVVLLLYLISTIGKSLLNWQEEQEKAAYFEEIRVLVEADHDGVTVLDAFTLQDNTDGSIVDTMFICQTSTDIVVGCIYVYEGEDTLYYEAMAHLPLTALLENTSPIQRGFFTAVTSDYRVNYEFYKEKADLPSAYVHLSTLEVREKTVYFVVTEIIPTQA